MFKLRISKPIELYTLWFNHQYYRSKRKPCLPWHSSGVLLTKCERYFLIQQLQTLGGKLVPVFNSKDLIKILLKLLMIACRNHIFERIMCSVHKELFGDTSGPENTSL